MNEYILGILIALAAGFLLVIIKYMPRSRWNPRSWTLTIDLSPKRKMVPATVPSEALDIRDEARFNFRNTRWEMSKKAVLKAEDFATPLSEAPDSLVFSSKMGHLDCLISYVFEPGDRLCGARYIFQPDYADGTRYLADFDFLLKVIQDKFGPPQQNSIEWLNETFKDNKDFFGFALMEGHFERTVEWLTQRTLIACTLGREDGRIFYHISYVPTTPLDPFFEGPSPVMARPGDQMDNSPGSLPADPSGGPPGGSMGDPMGDLADGHCPDETAHLTPEEAAHIRMRSLWGDGRPWPPDSPGDMATLPGATVGHEMYWAPGHEPDEPLGLKQGAPLGHEPDKAPEASKS